MISRLPVQFFPLPLPPIRANFNSMIAVIKVAGQQYKVEKDQTLYVPRVEGKAGDKVEVWKCCWQMQMANCHQVQVKQK